MKLISYTFFSDANGTFTKVYYILNHNLNKFKTVDI